ncbi:MAG: hypothetical protein FWC27_12845 [Firmicutes bacterium]|nr:hypothetical protein [Bacillota bacterium]
MKELTIPPKLEKITGSVLGLFPLALAALVMEPRGCAMAACLAALWLPMELAGLRVSGIVLILIQDIALRHGGAPAIIAALLCAGLLGPGLLLYARREKSEKIRLLGEKLKAPRAFYPGLALGAALMMALYQCSGYFAVGAHGAGMLELLRSYRGLGFHPNWRTVLFSTVMLVILITWPRKFKRLSRVLPAAFVGLAAAAALNFLLNPDPARSTVLEFPAAWLPFFGRVPISALSMVLIFAAWEEVPWKRVRECFRSPARGAVPLALIAAAMFSFDLLWVLAGMAAVWGGVCLIKKSFPPKPPSSFEGAPASGG